MAERLFIRIFVSVSLCVAMAAFALAPVPADAEGHPVLPAVAVGQVGLYRLEVALLAFYGGLLLITPAVFGLARGRLPIEISARGAKFAVEVDQASALPKQAELEELHEVVKQLLEELAMARRGMEWPRDNTHPKVSSKHD